MSSDLPPSDGLELLARAMRPFYAMLFGLLVLIALVPALSTAWPNALFSK